jgi:lipid-A-disaccharide synthase-like uncharacterized protein
MKKVKLLHIVFLIVSLLFGLYGIYLLLNDGDSIQIICFIIGGIILGYNDWKIFLTKNK